MNPNTAHTTQLLRLVQSDHEFSVFKSRRPKKTTGCTTRIVLVKRHYETGKLVRTRITTELLEAIRSHHNEPEAQRALCESLIGTRRTSTTFEPVVSPETREVARAEARTR